MVNTEPNWDYEGKNSLVRYIVAVEFAPELPENLIAQVSKLHATFREALPRKTEQQLLTLQLGHVPPPPSANLGGVTFDKIRSDGVVERQLAVASRSVVFFLTDYSRWKNFFDDAWYVMNPVLDLVFSHSSITAIVLEAQNTFIWKGANLAPIAGELIKPECIYVAPNISQHSGPCHSFHGFAMPSTNPKGTRVDNINFGTQNPNEKGVPAALNFQYRLNFEVPITDYDQMEHRTPGEFLAAKFKELHDVNNLRFKQTVLREIWEKMEGLV
jgi:uncharacterized protein (TIGR04255 family)